MSVSKMSREFVDSLPEYMHCSFCVKLFTPAITFRLLACRHVSCENCAQKMIRRGTDIQQVKIGCVHCKKMVAHMPIDEDMPPKYRGLFDSLDKRFEEMVEAKEFQAIQYEEFLSFKEREVANILKATEKNLGETLQMTKQIDLMEDKCQELERYLLQYIDKDTLAPLMELENFDNLDFEALAESYLSRRSQSSQNRRDSIHRRGSIHRRRSDSDARRDIDDPFRNRSNSRSSHRNSRGSHQTITFASPFTPSEFPSIISNVDPSRIGAGEYRHSRFSSYQQLNTPQQNRPHDGGPSTLGSLNNSRFSGESSNSSGIRGSFDDLNLGSGNPHGIKKHRHQNDY